MLLPKNKHNGNNLLFFLQASTALISFFAHLPHRCSGVPASVWIVCEETHDSCGINNVFLHACADVF